MVLLLGRRHWCSAWFGLKCSRVEIEDEERFEELQRELKPRTLISLVKREVRQVKGRRHTWYELMYRQCLLRLIRSTSGPGSSSSVTGLVLGSPFGLADFLDFFFFFFFEVVVVSSNPGMVSSSRGVDVRVSLVIDGLVEGTCSTALPMSGEAYSIAIVAMNDSKACANDGQCGEAMLTQGVR